MKKDLMLKLNTPEVEIQLEFALLANDKPQMIEKLVKAGWGIYPQVLNALVCMGYTSYVHSIMQSAADYERYPVNEMQKWMAAYYEQNWKFQVKEFGLQKIAAAFLSYEECEEVGFNQAIAEKNTKGSWAIIAEMHGIESLKETYVELSNKLNQGSSVKDKERVAELERFLLSQGEYAFLYERQCWSTLSLSFEGCKYIVETKHYMNGLAECLLSYSANMDDKTQAYCVAVLRNVHLDDNYGPRFEAWKKKHLLKE